MEQAGNTTVADLEAAKAIIAIQKERIRRLELTLTLVRELMGNIDDMLNRIDALNERDFGLPVKPKE